MFVDKVKIYIKAGEGGGGCVSFYTEKHAPRGGPDGGDGGKGGDVVFLAADGLNSLSDLFYNKRYKAQNGGRGGGRYASGKTGEDLIIRVPAGTVIKDCESGKTVADLFRAGDRATVLRGGAGGRGNAYFKSPTRRAPRFCQSGQRTTERRVTAELMTIADVGLVGMPNAGKSSLLAAVSAARPKIANYPFTTLSPSVGVVKHKDKTFTVADIPGLIEGASGGAGLGTAFLRHIERTRLLVRVVDISGGEGRDPVGDYKKINAELAAYGERLAGLKQIAALNKTDLVADGKNIRAFKRAVKIRAYPVSCLTGEGIEELLAAVSEELDKLPPPQPLRFEPFEYKESSDYGYRVERGADGGFTVSGGLTDALARNVILDDRDSFNYFQRKLRETGVTDALRAAGIKDGDTVRILDVEFEFVE